MQILHKRKKKNIDECTSYCSYIYHRSFGFLQQFKFEFFLEEWVKHLVEGSSQSIHPLSVPLLNQMTELVLQRKKYGTIDEQHIEASDICAALSLEPRASTCCTSVPLCEPSDVVASDRFILVVLTELTLSFAKETSFTTLLGVIDTTLLQKRMQFL